MTISKGDKGQREERKKGMSEDFLVEPWGILFHSDFHSVNILLHTGFAGIQIPHTRHVFESPCTLCSGSYFPFT